MSSDRPVIIAVASGKGGVGKTMLTVALAAELSRASRVLLLDLDFFNRGLTGLFGAGQVVAEIPRPSFLGGGPADGAWKIVEVAPKMLHVSFPDLMPDELGHLEALSAQDLAEQLGRFARSAAAAADCALVVLDCHGGPDRTSFAAALAARHTLLVSEPDQVTFHGTFNFLRQLERVAEGAKPDLRLVFNKVVPDFSVRFLEATYAQYFQDQFAGHPLLAVFPLEIYLTRAFEETPIVSAVYPYSLLARKMGVLVRDLIGTEHGGLLSPEVTSLPGWVCRYRREALGRVPALLDYNNCLAVFAVGGAVALFLLLGGKMFLGHEINLIDPVTNNDNLLVLLLSWNFVTLLVAACRVQERKAVCLERKRRIRECLLTVFLPAGFIWFLPLAICSASWQHGFSQRNGSASWLSFLAPAPLLAFVAFAFANQLWLAYRAARYRRRRMEPALRLAFLLMLSTELVFAYLAADR